MMYQRIPDDNYNKLLFQLRTQLNAIWNSCRCYGLNDLVDGNVELTVQLTENFAMTVRGKEKPIHVLSETKDRPTD